MPQTSDINLLYSRVTVITVAEVVEIQAHNHHQSINQSINQTNYIIVRPKVDHRAGQLSLPHLGITKTENNRTET